MLREDRGYNVKVKKLVVKGLYNRYNYDVHFNEELTFLLGANGSGKTTILDILSSIITGELYRLNNYEFDTIELNYLNKEDKQDAPNTIIITSTDDGDMELSFNGEHHKLHYLEHDSDVSHQLKRIKYFREYPVLEKIRGLFPFINLPLNRYSYVGYNDRYIYDIDDALYEAQEIITKAWQGVSQIKQKLDREFGLTETLHESIALEEKNLTAFLETMNSFFGDGEDAITKKELKWSDGNLVFQSKYLMFWKLWTKSKHRFGVLFRRYNKSLLYTIMLYNP